MGKSSFSLSDFGEDFARRFASLMEQVKQGAMPKESPAIVPAAGAASQLRCIGFDGGTDVKIVLVRPHGDVDGKSLRACETLTYRPDIAGTDLVYDLTGEFLQGKARPFMCDLTQQSARLYAVLPFQVERMVLRAESRLRLPAVKEERAALQFEIEFHNGLGRRVRGALPCHARLAGPDGMVFWERHLASSKKGTICVSVELPADAKTGNWSLTVRSLLNGQQVALPFEVSSAAAK